MWWYQWLTRINRLWSYLRSQKRMRVWRASRRYKRMIKYEDWSNILRYWSSRMCKWKKISVRVSRERASWERNVKYWCNNKVSRRSNGKMYNSTIREYSNWKRNCKRRMCYCLSVRIRLSIVSRGVSRDWGKWVVWLRL